VPHRILLVVARRLIAEGLEALFRQQPDWQAALAGNVEEALVCVEQQCPEAAMVDLSLSDGGAFFLFQQLRSRGSKVRVVFLDDSVHPCRLAAVQSLRAAGYFTLRDSFASILAGLRQVLAGRTVYSVSPEAGAGFPSGPPASGDVASPLSRLSRREMEVLIHLARGLTVKECAEHLHLSPNTVDNHKARLMSKLGLHRSTDLVRLAIREKLIEQ
jgi:DNA-binding NarL/FixJ family response regulator